MTEPIQMRAKIVRWCGRPGRKVTQYGSGRNNSKPKPRHYTGVLAENAITSGWLNGRRRGKGAR